MASDDQAEFEAYVARDSGRLHGFAALLGGTWPDAEDLVQQALLRAASRWPTARERPEAYTRKILVNLARDRWRSRRFTAEHAADDLADLPAAVEVACYRIVTEALTNVTRHAHATQCSVCLRLNHGLDVKICDDGVGLPEGWRAGVGIASMRERVTELGGDLVIEPNLPHGTRINAHLPGREQE